MTLAHNDLSPPRRVFQPDVEAPSLDYAPGAGLQSCLQACERLGTRAPGFWLALAPCRRSDTQAFDALLDAALDSIGADLPYAAIAALAERAPLQGIGAGSAPALVLLAALALDYQSDGRDHTAHAHALAKAGLALAMRQEETARGMTCALHAALVAPFLASPANAAGAFAAACARWTPTGGSAVQDGAMARLAQAARKQHGGDLAGALRDVDRIGADAAACGRHWLAGLAWEQAAALALDCGLQGASRYYREQALSSCAARGAPGRAAMLRRAWCDGVGAGRRAARPHLAAKAAPRDSAGHSVGELGVSIAHEVNQPLAAIALHTAAARKWLQKPQPNIERALASLEQIGAAGQHAGEVVRSVRRLALDQRQSMEAMEQVPVDAVIADTVCQLRRLLRRHAVEIDVQSGLGDCCIHASRVQLQQVLTNLLVNAVEALAGCAPGARRIALRSSRSGDTEVEIAVSDNGPGIAPEHAGRVFGSLYSTKPNGTGMGLAISLAIVRGHGGRIAYEACAPHGACFRVRLPLRCEGP